MTIRRDETTTVNNTHPSRLLLFVAIVVLLPLHGCGDGKCPVQGNVVFDGQPVASGTIVFEPADGQGPTTGGEIIDGKYQLAGKAAPLPGKKKVRISSAQKTGRMIPAGPPAPAGMMVEEVKRWIPVQYNEQTTLSCEVSPGGSKQIDFDLKP